MITGYLGPKGSYSELAHDSLFNGDNKKEFKDFYAIFDALYKGEIQSGVIPVENSIQGTVTECLDLLFKYKGIYITKEYILKIRHGLIAKTAAKLSDIHTVYSHEQAIKQCGKFLSTYLPGADIIYTDSTSKGADCINEKGKAAIVGRHYKKCGLEFLNYEVADENNNETKFAVIEKGKANLKNHTGKIFIAAGGKNKPGELLGILSMLAENNFNMTKIESRPSKNKMGEYIFFIEFEGDYFDEKVKKMLLALKQNVIGFKLLGCY